MENILKDGTEKALRETKAWLTREDLRLKAMQRELEDKQKKHEEEKNTFEKEMKHHQHKMKVEKERLEQENRLLEQKLKILQQGYIQLEEDKHRLQREKDKFNSKRNAYAYESQSFSHHSQVAEMMFSGVNSYLTLKKRYKDNWESGLDCVDSILFLGSNSKETLEYMVSLLRQKDLV